MLYSLYLMGLVNLDDDASMLEAPAERMIIKNHRWDTNFTACKESILRLSQLGLKL
jgi:hypothetical protein